MKTTSLRSDRRFATGWQAARLALARPAPLALLCAGLLSFYAVRTAAMLVEADGLVDSEGYLVGRDFVVWWLAAKAAIAGHLADVFDRGLFHAAQVAAYGAGFPEHLWLYPPHYVLLLLPVVLAPYAWSLAAWTAAGFAAHAASVVVAGARRWQTALLLLSAPATYVNAVYGQNGFLTAALLVAGLRLLPAHPVLSGVAFGLLTVKPHLGLLVPVALLVTGSWRTIVSGAVTAAAMIGLSVALYGVEPWAAYLTATLDSQSMAVRIANEMMITPFAAAVLLGGSAAVCTAVTAAGMGLGVACVAWAYRQPARPALRHAVLIVATFLAVPYALTYDLTAVSAAIALVWLALAPAERTLGIKAMLFAAWLLPLAGNLANVAGVPVGPVVLAGLLAMLLRLVRRDAATGVSAAARSASR